MMAQSTKIDAQSDSKKNSNELEATLFATIIYTVMLGINARGVYYFFCQKEGGGGRLF